MAGAPLAKEGIASTGTPVSDNAQAPPVSWAPCDPDDFPTVAADGSSIVPGSYECATYQVPLDYDHPLGDTIDLALIRRPADDPSRRQGSLFFNPGGPGGSGVDSVALGGESLFGPEVLASFDLIGFDPRGVERSTPLQCFESNEAVVQFQGQLEPQRLWPTTVDEFLAAFLNAHTLAEACAQRAGPILDHMGSTNVARDLDVLRRAVGDDALNFAGDSYGTYLCAQYIAQYPERTGALVCDSAIEPVEYATGQPVGISRVIPTAARLNTEVGTNATLGEFFRLCAAAGPDACAFAPDPAQRYARLLEAVEQNPLELPGGTFDEQRIILTTLLGLYDSGLGWEMLAGQLAGFEEELVGGSTPEQGDQAPPPENVIAASVNVRYRNTTESALGVFCSDNLQPSSYFAWVAAILRADGVFGPFWAAADLNCSAWPGRDTDAFLGPFDQHTAHPVLVISNRFDPATPYENAVAFQARLPNSALFTVQGWGHVARGTAACAARAIDEYLLTRQVPRASGCTQEEVPFSDALMAAVMSDAAEPKMDADVAHADRQSWDAAMDQAAEASMGAMLAGERPEESMRVAASAAENSLRQAGYVAAADRLRGRYVRAFGTSGGD